MADKIRRIDFSPDEFLVGVSGLPSADIGVYWVICSLMYSSGSEVAIDDRRIFGVCADHKNKVKASIQRLIDAGVLQTNGSHLTNKRVTKELDRAQTRITNARDNGEKGGRPRVESEQKQTLKKPNPLSDEKLTNNYQLTTINQQDTPIPPKGVVDYSDAFLVFWKAYPKKDAKDAAWRAWKKKTKGVPLETIMAALNRYQREKPADTPWKNPATWINGGCWKDFEDAEPGIDMAAIEQKWQDRLKSWRAGGEWKSFWGPKIGEPDCMIPPSVAAWWTEQSTPLEMPEIPSCLRRSAVNA